MNHSFFFHTHSCVLVPLTTKNISRSNLCPSAAQTSVTNCIPADTLPTGLYDLCSRHSTHLYTSHRFPVESPAGPPTRTVIKHSDVTKIYWNEMRAVSLAIKQFRCLELAPTCKVSSTNWTKRVCRTTCFSLSHGRCISSQRDTAVQFLASSFFRHGTFCGPLPYICLSDPPLPPLLHRTTEISPPLLLPLEARKQARLSVSLSVALALTALASVGIVRAAPFPHHWVAPASPIAVCYVEAELAGPSRSAVGLLPARLQLLLPTAAVFTAIYCSRPANWITGMFLLCTCLSKSHFSVKNIPFVEARSLMYEINIISWEAFSR